MNRVLFVTPYYDPNIVGGAEISTQLIAEGKIAESFVLTGGDKKGIRELNGVKIHETDRLLLKKSWKKVLIGESTNIIDSIAINILNSISIPNWVREYEKLIIENKIDIVILNTNIDALGRMSIWKAVENSKIPSILVLRDPILLQKKIFGINVGKLFSSMIKKQSKGIYAFAAPSQYMINLYKKQSVENAKNYVIPNAVDNDFVISDFSRKQNNVIYAGSLREEKGIYTLLNAFEIGCNYNDIKLEIFGSGELEGLCKSKLYVKFNKWISRNELYLKMKKCKVVVLPSEYPEAFGRILVEAVAQGTLVIGSNAGGIPEVLDNDDRYMFDAGDAKKLSELIERIICLDEKSYIDEVTQLQLKFSRFRREEYLHNWGLLIDDVLRDWKLQHVYR